jgi:hypothetical protein
MSDERNEHTEAERDSAPAEPAPVEEAAPWKAPPGLAEPPESPRRSRPWLAIGIAASLLLVVVVGVLLSPFWAPAIRPLLPWGEPSDTAKYETLAGRVAALEARPVTPAFDPEAIKRAQSAQTQKLAALEDDVGELRQGQQAAATKSALAQQSQRFDAAEAQSAARVATQAAEIAKMQQELAQRSTLGAELATRIDTLEHQLQAQNDTQRREAVRLLALLQMREALETGRPFAAEYATFTRLVENDPELLGAALPLADGARNGIASPAELHQRVAALADLTANAPAPAAASSWWEEALNRIRALVRVQRIDGAGQTGPDTAVDAAQAALAKGDLAGAVAALDGPRGVSAPAIEAWLKLARQRLAAEAALTHLQSLLTAQLGTPNASPAKSAPASTTPPPSTPPKAPS